MIDQSGIGPEVVKGAIRGRITQLLMWAAYHEPVREALLMVAQLLGQVPQTGGIDYVRVFIRYVVATQEDTTVAEFDEMLKAQTGNTGGEIVTYAQQLLLEGKLEGKLEERVELINGFLRAGVSWSTITEATGVDQVQFAELKRQLAQLQEEVPA